MTTQTNNGNKDWQKNKKDDPPYYKSIEEMYQVEYGPNTPKNVTKKQRYRDFLQQKHWVPHFENRIRNLFVKLQDFDKVKETEEKKTVDFVSNVENLFVEVTSINLHMNREGSFKKKGTQKFIKSFNKCINHLYKKSEVSNYKYKFIAISFCTELDMFLQDCIKKELLNKGFLSKTLFFEKDLTGLIYLLHHYGGDGNPNIKDIFVLKDNALDEVLKELNLIDKIELVYVGE